MRSLFLFVLAFAPVIFGQSPYLPLAEGNKWTLKNGGSKRPLVIEVLGQEESAFRVRFASPYATNEWMLEPKGDKYFMTKFGANGQFMDLPADTLYFDFGASEGTEWKNVIGKMKVVRKDGDSMLIQQDSKGGKLLFGFEPGKGFVQFGEGKGAFNLSEDESTIGGSRSTATPAALPLNPGTSPASDTEPVAHVPTPAPVSTGTPTTERVPERRGIRATGGVLFSITPNVFANEKMSPENLLDRFEMVVDAGMTFLVHNAKWNEFEPKKGQYSLDGLNFNIETAKRLNIPVAYTFRLIETVDRSMPGDLAKLKWTDPKVEERLLKVLETIVPRFEKRVRWFMLGNEIDGYFGRHPDEIEAYAKLFAKAKRRIQELDPAIQVSSTLMYGGIRTLDGPMQPLNNQYDFLCFTYYPIRGDFTMKDPGIVRNDIGIMRQYAKGRKVVLQEVGYPSGSVNQSTEEKQAQFVRNIFRELRANSDMVEAACFWLLADLKDEFVRELTKFYGVDAGTFKSFLQTLGMFDAKGQPKPAWDVYRAEIKR